MNVARATKRSAILEVWSHCTKLHPEWFSGSEKEEASSTEVAQFVSDNVNNPYNLELFTGDLSVPCRRLKSVHWGKHCKICVLWWLDETRVLWRTGEYTWTGHCHVRSANVTRSECWPWLRIPRRIRIGQLPRV